jgi:hypothetical protein
MNFRLAFKVITENKQGKNFLLDFYKTPPNQNGESDGKISLSVDEKTYNEFWAGKVYEIELTDPKEKLKVVN